MKLNWKRRAQDKGLVDGAGLWNRHAMIAGTPLALPTRRRKAISASLRLRYRGIQNSVRKLRWPTKALLMPLVWGRDLSAEVGGISALTALEMFGADDKKSGAGFCVKTTCRSCSPADCYGDESHGKTCCGLFLGYKRSARDENVWFADALDDAARLACLLARVTARRGALFTTGDGVIQALYRRNAGC